ncbi:hypothetical protein [Micromonospora sp. WMMD812]|uniref:hypothetical protein n=1 Tax=Micromonospora sp. WMMD812 TaxID=3015152 RepID=UPI00248D2B78|nr:hypothetical protein [Micromonospora sp. WMMD812]WBB69838.1 hypothetical protein O7603_10980 [Micromonospora sp. WMMD812]
MTRAGFTLSAVIAGVLLAAAPALDEASTDWTARQPAAESPALAGETEFAAEPASGTALAGAPAPEPASSVGGQPGPVVDVFVEVSPSTVEPGFLVGLKASCRDNSIPATVVSDAFGRVQVQPQRGLLTATPMVRERTRPGNYRVKLECRDGETASTMLQVVKAVKPSRGPATGFGGSAGGFTGGLLVPGGIALTIAGLVVAIVALRRPRTVRR